MQNKTKLGMAIALILLSVIGTALLTSYGTVNSRATVTQAVTVTGIGCTDNNCYHDFGSVSGGTTHTYCDINITNSGDVPAPIKFVTSVLDNSSNDASDAVTVRYLSTVELKSKYQQNWTEMNDGREAEVTFELVETKFNYDIEASGLVSSTDYSLIYYADPWAGDNPGALIGEFTTDLNGDISETDLSEPLNMNLPDTDDANYDAYPNYCAYNNGADDYDLCTGAKLWLVPSSDYDDTTNQMNTWNPDNYLFETDLITYNDKNDMGKALYVGKGEFEMCVEVTFASATAPDTYTINMTVVPV